MDELLRGREVRQTERHQLPTVHRRIPETEKEREERREEEKKREGKEETGLKKEERRCKKGGGEGERGESGGIQGGVFLGLFAELHERFVLDERVLDAGVDDGARRLLRPLLGLRHEGQDRLEVADGLRLELGGNLEERLLDHVLGRRGKETGYQEREGRRGEEGEGERASR
jgi:hypothetical protein